jgi:hypothetical protein
VNNDGGSPDRGGRRAWHNPATTLQLGSLLVELDSSGITADLSLAATPKAVIISAGGATRSLHVARDTT